MRQSSGTYAQSHGSTAAIWALAEMVPAGGSRRCLVRSCQVEVTAEDASFAHADSRRSKPMTDCRPDRETVVYCALYIPCQSGCPSLSPRHSLLHGPPRRRDPRDGIAGSRRGAAVGFRSPGYVGLYRRRSTRSSSPALAPRRSREPSSWRWVVQPVRQQFPVWQHRPERPLPEGYWP